MSTLLDRFNHIAALHPIRSGHGVGIDEREMVGAALVLGASMALARIHEIGGAYISGNDIKKIEDELNPKAAMKEPTRPAAPVGDSADNEVTL